jgi:hypothetical protein
MEPTTATPVSLEILERTCHNKRIRCMQCQRVNLLIIRINNPIRVVCNCTCGLTSMLYPIEDPQDLIQLRLRLVA